MIPSTPLRFQGLQPPPVAVPHAVGEDNEDVYGELLGLNADEVKALRESSAI